MRAADIRGAMRLKEAAGWNQTERDWERVLRLEPGGCFADERDGTVAGTTTAVRLGSGVSWIGMVLVLPEFRRRGIARSLMEHALEWLASLGQRVVRLDATDMGRPLYLDLGFRDEQPVERWERPPQEPPSGRRQGRSADGFLPSHANMDRDACGFDRSALLRDLASDHSVERAQSETGFAFGRPGSAAWFVGPCIAGSEREAGSLLADVLGGHERQRVYWDLLPANGSAVRLARGMGFRRVRRLTRMARAEGGAPAPEGRALRVYATAGFEFG